MCFLPNRMQHLTAVNSRDYDNTNSYNLYAETNNKSRSEIKGSYDVTDNDFLSSKNGDGDTPRSYDDTSSTLSGALLRILLLSTALIPRFGVPKLYISMTLLLI